MTSSVPRKIRNPKPEIRNKSECQNSKLKRRSFGHWYLGNLDLFRISDFGFRILFALLFINRAHAIVGRAVAVHLEPILVAGRRCETPDADRARLQELE